MNMLRTYKPEYGCEDKSVDCNVCASRGIHNVHHRHFSSAFQRATRISEGFGTMNCPVCQVEHPLGVMCTPRLKVIFSSSTLHNAQLAEDWEGTGGYHIDLETMCGAKVLQGKEMWEKVYADLAMPIDTHVTMGVNDVLAMSRQLPTVAAHRALAVQEHTADFMSRLEAWYNATVQHTSTHGLDSPDRFSVSKIIRAPQMYTYPGNTYGGWSTCNDLLDSINTGIGTFNQAIRTSQGEILGGTGNSPVVAGLSNLGTRKSPRGRAHAWNEWREVPYHRKLHLDLKRQAKGLRMVAKYLRTHTPNAPTQYFNLNNNNDNNNTDHNAENN